MMKNILSILIVLSATGLFGQTSEWEKCGLNNNPELNEYEAKYFNEVFKERKGSFNFTGKTIAYYSGSLGTTKSEKSNYFRCLKNAINNEDRTIHEWQAGGTQLLVLTKEEKEISGGYDAILVSWSKLLKRGKSRNKLVKKLKNKLPNKK